MPISSIYNNGQELKKPHFRTKGHPLKTLGQGMGDTKGFLYISSVLQMIVQIYTLHLAL